MALTPLFNQVEVDLAGIPLNNPTSLQFGPDGRLYVSQQDGLIRSVAIKPLTDSNGNITKFVISNAGGADSTDLVQDIPNHNDDGSLSTQGNRQVTGLAVEEGSNGETVLYVSSSDPRIGGKADGTDKNLDTNSGIISRLTKQADGSWEKVDLVIGLPRSEENHSTNGLDIRTEDVNGQPHQIMYVVSGGSTNRGAPSNNFAWTPEYYYSAGVLRIDLTQLEQIEATEGLKGGTDYVDPYVYALPTLNDPTRSDNAKGQDTAAGITGPSDAEAADTFGGNDGRNQAKYDPNGPVQVYSMGYRNAYDIVITENDNIYTFDNGPNNGWGDIPLEADGSTPITSSSQVATNYPNIDVNTGNDTDPDNLHLVTEDFYAGHPNPIYASGAEAGLYWVDTSSGSPVVTQLTDPSDPNNDPNTTLDDLPADWNEIAGGLTNPEAGVYLAPGDNPDGTNKGPDGSLVTIGSSTNGLAEYVAGKVGGDNPITDISGAEVLGTVAFNGNLYFMEIVADGTQAGTELTDISPVLVGGTPLDVNDVEAFAFGTEDFSDSLFIAQFGTDSITALVPGTPSATDIDKDDDGLEDNIDPLQYDPVNGTNTVLNADGTLIWDFNPADSGIHPGPSGEYNIGMTGWMINNSWYLEEDADPALTDLDNTIRGGAPGIFQVKSAGTGDLEGTGNDQQDAIQTGFLPAADVDRFTVKVPMFNPFSSDANAGVTFSESASMGFSLGDGTMSNWIEIAVAADNSAGAQVKVTYEENDSLIDSLSVDTPELLDAIDDDLVELYLTFDTNTFEVTPFWRYQIQGVWSDITQIGTSPVQLDSEGPIVTALQGQNSINGIQSAPVITMTSTSKGAQPFTADFLDLTVTDGNAIDENAPQITTANTVEVVENQTLIVNVEASDADGDTEGNGLTYSLSGGADLLLFDIDANTGNLSFTAAPDFEAPEDSDGDNNYLVDVSVSDSTGLTDTQTFSVNVNDLPESENLDLLYRINVGGEQVSATDGSTTPWSADTDTNPSEYLVAGGEKISKSNKSIDISSLPEPVSAPETIFQTERWDPPSGDEMRWEFPVDADGTYEIRLYFAETFGQINAAKQRTFDIEVEGSVPSIYDDIDQYAIAGSNTAFMLPHTTTVDDGNLSLDIEFLRGKQNPSFKGVEIFSTVDEVDGTTPTIITANTVDVAENQTLVVDVEASDADGDTEGNGLTYSLSGGADLLLFDIDANTGDLSFTAAPDFEAPEDSDGDNNYLVDVSVSDSTGLTNTQTISVNVTDVDESENLDLLYRINVGGEQVSATDGSTTPWSADTKTNPSEYLVAGGEKIFETNKSIDITGLQEPVSAPEAIFQTERWDPPSGTEMRWEFPVDADGTYEIRLYFAETFGQINAAKQRTFDIEVEGSVPNIYDDIDQYAIAGSNTAFMLPHTTTVDDGNLTLDIEFLRGKQNPSFKGVEIFAVDSSAI